MRVHGHSLLPRSVVSCWDTMNQAITILLVWDACHVLGFDTQCVLWPWPHQRRKVNRTRCPDSSEIYPSSDTPENISACGCLAGYEPIDINLKASGCSPCSLLDYKNMSGNWPCSPCASEDTGYTSARSNGHSCSCEDGLEYSKDHQVWKSCAAGKYHHGLGGRLPCDPGKFTNMTGRSQCEACERGF